MGVSVDVLEEELLRILRRRRTAGLEELAEAVGLPRTNFGRQLTHRIEEPLAVLVDEGRVERCGRQYRLVRRGPA